MERLVGVSVAERMRHGPALGRLGSDRSRGRVLANMRPRRDAPPAFRPGTEIKGAIEMEELTVAYAQPAVDSFN